MLNVYKKILILYLSFFIFYIQTQEKTEKNVRRAVKKIARGDSKGIDKLDLLIKQKTASILNTLAVDFNALTNRMVHLADNLAALTLVVNNLSIETQLGLICTSAASPTLKTPFTTVDYNSEVIAYNTAIINALAIIAIALYTPSKNNTAAAQSALAFAITDFMLIMAEADSLAVSSPYSISETYAALIKLNAQLDYLYLLQAS